MGWWRDLMGPGQEEIWRQFAEQVGGRFTDGGWFGQDRVDAQWQQWTLTLDYYVAHHGKSSTKYTRMRAPYVSRDGFRFKVYRASVFTPMGKALGMVQDHEIGHERFDENFVVQGPDEARVRRMLRNEKIRALIEEQPDISFEVKDDEGYFGKTFPGGVDELYFQAHGEIRDLDQLRRLYDLFIEVLDYLCTAGHAHREDPRIELK